jgi:hypothetical protein
MYSQKRNCTASAPLPLLRLKLMPFGQCNGDRSEFSLRGLEHVNERGMKNVLHCNKNPIYLFLEKELLGFSPAAPAAAHIN